MAFGREHYWLKEQQERRLAQTADGQARVIHRLSAELYAELARQEATRSPR